LLGMALMRASDVHEKNNTENEIRGACCHH
jgi:hypothetical protein